MEPTYYQILQVKRDATPAQIKQAYRKLMKLHHPDRLESARTQADTDIERRIVERQIREAQQNTQRINLAYTTLIDAEKRRRYDASLPGAAVPSSPPSYRTYQPPPPPQSPPRPQKRQPEQPEFMRRIGIFLFVLLALLFVCELSLRAFPAEPITSERVTSADLTARAQPTFDALDLPDETTDESTVAVYARLAMAALDDEDYDGAIEDLSLALFVVPESAGLYYLRGVAYRSRARGVTDGDNDLAIADFSRSLDYKPTYAAALYQRGLIYYDRWRIFGEEGYRRAALNDLSRFSTLATDVNINSVLAIITQLERSAPDD